MFLYENESVGTRRARLRNMAQRVLHRLGDSAEAIWTRDEIESYIRLGAREMANVCRMIWDQAFLENLPAGFSYTSRYERHYITFDYGRGGYTYEEEGLLADAQGVVEVDDLRRAAHTSPADLAFLVEIDAPTDIPAVVDLPGTLTDIDRVTWDQSKIEATTHRRVVRYDSRYEITEGEVFAYIWQKEGPMTLRKVRVPNEQAWVYEHEGSWGIARNIDDVNVASDSVEGTWGIPRRIAGWHPMGWSEGWGTPRRFYREERNVKLEFWRQPYIESMTDTELPDQYFRYVAYYAQWQALKKNGAGQDFKLAQLYAEKWKRNVARVIDRIERQNKERTVRMGGSTVTPGAAPPRPRLPWQYGQIIR